MFNRVSKIFALFIVLFVASNTFLFSEIVTYIEGGDLGDDIFKNEKVEKDDFYTIKIEPKKEDVKKGTKKSLEDIKQKKLAFLRRLEAEQKKVDNAKKEILDNKAKMKADLEKKKTAMKGEKAPKTKEPEKKEVVKKEAPAEIQVTPKTIEESEKAMNKSIKLREKFIDCGLDLQGTRYVWGGKTPNPGLDCSGLVTYAAKKSIGVDLSGNAQTIYNKVTPIALSEAVPGDLVFFKGKYDPRITHVGIYLGNDSGESDYGKQKIFLNSASGGPRTGVIISGMNENYWDKTYYGCGRFLDPLE